MAGSYQGAGTTTVISVRRATPAEYKADGKDYVRTDRNVLFGHYFAAIAGAGPLVGPVIAAQMDYLPGTIWIIIGVVLAGAVQDWVNKPGAGDGEAPRGRNMEIRGKHAHSSAASVTVAYDQFVRSYKIHEQSNPGKNDDKSGYESRGYRLT